jgi:tRNA threonylcarbamoyladenosine biosynthesis protein TsaB
VSALIPPSLILGLSTATPRGSVALVRDGESLASTDYEDEKRHAERIFGSIDDVLSRVGVTRSDIDAVACDIGPGSFTGVRVGVATAKGIGFALGVPVVGVCGLEAMARAAHAATPGHKWVVALLDGRRGETFYAAYDDAGVAFIEPAHAPVAQTMDALGPAVDDPSTLYCGRFAGELALSDERRVVHVDADLPSAAWIARIGAERIGQANEIEPLYVRAPDAKPQRPRKPLF